MAASVHTRLEEITGRRPTFRNRIQLLANGLQSYAAMLDLVTAAGHQLLLENFIFRDDAVGRAFAAALRDRAGSGVDVRVLHDPFGSLMSLRAPIGFRFRGSPVAVRVFNPPRLSRAFFREGRDHRKLMVQDRSRLVAGGMCLADVWSGNCVRHCTWRDSAVLVEGEAAGEAASEFERMWTKGTSFARRAGDPDPRRQEVHRSACPATTTPEREGRVPVRIVASERGARRLERVLVTVCRAARREILLTNPYVVPPESVLAALTEAVHRGVRVELIVPRQNNHRVAELASEHLQGPLLDAGVRIWRWEGPMLHAKTVVVDRRWSLVGSSNLDILSLRRNAELDIEIHGTAPGRRLAAMFRRDRAGSTPFTRTAWKRRGAARRSLAGAAALARGWL